MAQIQNFLNSSQETVSFPWAIENFGNYLDEKSFWMIKNDAYGLYFNKTKRELCADDVSSLSRRIEHNYESKNDLKAYEWENIVTYSEEFQCLYMSGNIDITDDKNIKLINDNDLVIIHEPFNLEYLNADLSLTDYGKVIPKQDLLDNQSQFVNSLNFGKRKVGLHIRRGDYDRWEGGKYFFEDDFWLAKVKQLINKDYAVYVFSNEVNSEFHNKIRNIWGYVSNESFEVDFVRMMLMNEIYGPPSTFSVMAVRIARKCFDYDNEFHYLPAKS